MDVLTTVDALRAKLAPARSKGRIGLVPTMGFFHQGHLSLIRAARQECETVVVSLFVNPTQFGPNEDLSSYPENLERDLQSAKELGVNVLFQPTPNEIYPAGFNTEVTVSDLADVLCGAPELRGPEHFNGVATVVAKLFNIVQPDFAYFGQKDAQQVRIIEQLVEDLNFPLSLRILPTVREPDGLAMSSRNSYLSAEERSQASALSSTLFAAEEQIVAGERGAEAIESGAKQRLRAAGVEPEYFTVVSAETLRPVDPLEGKVLLAVAARVGSARLIDNLKVLVPGADSSPSALNDRLCKKERIGSGAGSEVVPA